MSISTAMRAPRALTRDEACAIHDASLLRFGGLAGVRDEGLLDSALAQPFQSVFGQDLYPTLAEKAARYAFGIAKNHPSLDGNKRAATACMGAFLRLSGHRFAPRANELLSTMMGVADGSVSYEKLVAWIEAQDPGEVTP